MTNPQPPYGGPSGYRPEPVPSGPQQAGQNTPPPPPITKRGRLLTSKPVIGAAALLVGVALGAGSAGGGAGATSAVPAPAPTVTVTTTTTATPSVPTTSPSSEPTSEPTVEPVSTPEPEETTTEPTKPAKKEYKTLSSRAFKKFAKDPDSHLGKTYVIYGEITQFDSATGTDTFRANTGPKKLKISYGYTDYSQNTILTGAESEFDDLVEGDCFKAKVTVLGSYSYDTQIGGNTTVPMLWVDSISVYGSTD